MAEDVLDRYNQYLQGKEKRFWAIAKQVRLGTPEQIASRLQSGLLVRAATNYRFLGMVRSSGESGMPVQLTAVGNSFIAGDSVARQNLLDHQILKISLTNKARATLQSIDLFPTDFLIRLLLVVGTITFEEYKSIVIWAHPKDKIQAVASLVAAFRQASTTERKQIVSTSMAAASVDDFDDNIDRLYDLFFSASYFVEVERLGETHADMALAVTSEFARAVLAALDSAKPAMNSSYETWDESVSIGLPMVDEKEQLKFAEASDASDTTEMSPALTAVPLEQIEPQEVAITMSAASPANPGKDDFSDRRSRKKADYAARAARLADAGRRAEQVVVIFEKQRLTKAGRADLAGRVHHVADETDSHSFDVLSFDHTGTERHIEVKGIHTFKSTFVVYLTAEETRRALVDPLFSLVFVFDYASKEPLVYDADELLTLAKENLDPSEITSGKMVAVPMGWELRFSATEVEKVFQN